MTDFAIHIEQRDGDGNVLGSLSIEPGHSFVIRGAGPILNAVMSQTLHCFKALGCADVTFEPTGLEINVTPKALTAIALPEEGTASESP